MIQVGTRLKIADNSGGRWSKCIKVLGKGNKKAGFVGNTILVTVSKILSQKKIKKRTIYLGLIITLTRWVRRKEGSFIKFFLNQVVLFTKQYKFLGTRVYGIIAKEVHFCTGIDKKERRYFQKIVSYSPLIV